MQADSSFIRLTDLVDKGELRGKRVFIRSDLNVPRDANGNITEDTRIRASIPAIRAALKGGAAVMVTSHLGRPKEGVFSPDESLDVVAKRMSELLGQPVALYYSRKSKRITSRSGFEGGPKRYGWEAEPASYPDFEEI